MGETRSWRRAAGVLALVVTLAGITACGGGDGGGGDGDAEGAEPPDTTSTTGAGTAASDGRLYVLVTNGEGIASPGLSALVEALYQQPDTTVGVVAPDTTNPVPPAPLAEGAVPTVTFAATADGYPGIVLAADAADTVSSAVTQTLDGMPPDQGTPQLVVTGINTGQLIGPLAEFSNNVPAAQAAAAADVPALVVAQGVDENPPEYTAGVNQALAWIDDHREALLSGEQAAQVTLLNVPSCAVGEVRGVVEVPVAADAAGRDLALVDCTSTAEGPVDDVAAFTTGFATLSVLAPADATTATSGG